MAIRGKSDTSALLSSQLSPAALVRLACDILFLEGHRQIRITDGPGDGGRDVHSLTSKNIKHLTQCKFHKSTKKTASSADLSELPMAMIKLGYTAGLFVTNARISPQGKREYLDNYPKLQLEFMDGDTLAGHVLDKELLKSVWFDGKTVTAVNTTVTFPAIVRRHSDDASIIPFKNDNPPSTDKPLHYLAAKHPDIKFSIRQGRGDPGLFEPYRAPEPFTAEEGALPFIETIDITASGSMTFHEIQKLSKTIGKALLHWLGTGITVRVGTPASTPLTGENSGTRALLNTRPTSIISTQHSCGEEFNWFSIGDETTWSSENDARVSESSNIRLYNKSLNCVASYEIHSRPSAQERGFFELTHELRLHGWQRSIFALVPPTRDWNTAGVPPPDEECDWPWDDRVIYAWFHWSLQGHPTGVRTASMPDIELWGAPPDAEEPLRLETIRQAIAKMPNATILEANQARHMVALIGYDPLEIQRTITIRTADIVHFPDAVPSPINPHARRFGFSAAWIGSPSPESLELVTRTSSNALQQDYLNNIKAKRYGKHLLLSASITPTDTGVAPSSLILTAMHSHLSVLLSSIEQSAELNGLLTRDTKAFWSKHFSINFETSWRATSKQYITTSPHSEDLSLIGLPSALHPPSKK